MHIPSPSLEADPLDEEMTVEGTDAIDSRPFLRSSSGRL